MRIFPIWVFYITLSVAHMIYHKKKLNNPVWAQILFHAYLVVNKYSQQEAKLNMIANLKPFSQRQF